MPGAKKTDRLSPSAFLDLLAKPLPQAVALAGDSAYEKKRLLQSILERPAEHTTIRPFDSEQSAPSVEELANVSHDLLSVPLFGGRRTVVVIRRGDEFLKKGRAVLMRFLAQQARNSIVIAVNSFEKDAELEAAFAARGVIVACDKPGRRFGSSGEAALEWLTEEARRRSLPTEAGALALLIDLVGDDQERLSEELNKLALAAEGKKLGVALVQSLAAPSAMRSVDELLRPIFRGRAQDALRVLEVILREGLVHWTGRAIRGEESVPVPLLYWIHERVRKILATHEARAVGDQVARQAFAIRSDAQWRMLQSEGRLFTHQRARQALIDLYRAEDALKSGTSGRAVLTELVVRMCAGAGEAQAAGRA
jgi:DNA polymerase III delta subunit